MTLAARLGVPVAGGKRTRGKSARGKSARGRRSARRVHPNRIDPGDSGSNPVAETQRGIGGDPAVPGANQAVTDEIIPHGAGRTKDALARHGRLLVLRARCVHGSARSVRAVQVDLRRGEHHERTVALSRHRRRGEQRAIVRVPALTYLERRSGLGPRGKLARGVATTPAVTRAVPRNERHAPTKRRIQGGPTKPARGWGVLHRRIDRRSVRLRLRRDASAASPATETCRATIVRRHGTSRPSSPMPIGARRSRRPRLRGNAPVGNETPPMPRPRA